MLTFLALIFVIGLLAAILYGFGIVMRRPPSKQELESETCTICRQRFPKNALVLREIGDYKILWFCQACIRKLSEEVG